MHFFIYRTLFFDSCLMQGEIRIRSWRHRLQIPSLQATIKPLPNLQIERHESSAKSQHRLPPRSTLEQSAQRLR